MIENVCSDSGDIIVTKYSDGTIGIGLDKYNVGNFVKNIYTESSSSVIDELTYKINLIEKEYENQLQRQKIHISRGDGINGNRILGRRHKIAIPKRYLRNQEGIKGCPSQD